MHLRIPRRTVPRRTAPGAAAEPDDELHAPDSPARADDRHGSSEHELSRRPVAPPPAMLPRWVQLVLLPIGLLGLWALARAAGPVVLILIVASLVALVLNPLVKMLMRARLPRGLAIPAVYVGLFAALAVLGAVLANPVSNQLSHFEKEVPHLVTKANRDLANVQSWLDRHKIKIHIQKQGQTALQTLQKDILKRSSDIVAFSRSLVSRVLTIAFDGVLVLVLSIYLLVYGSQIDALVRRIMPDGDGTPEDDFPLLVQRAVSGYVRGQLAFSLIMGASAAGALTLLGVIGIFPDGERYAVFFGGWYGLMELIPYIGPILGAVPAVVVALFENPLTAVWVVLLFVALQQLEGHFVAPQVFRISLRINPILVIVALLIGYQIYGLAGALIALPVIAVLRQVVVYLRRHMVLEPWTTSGAGIGTGVLALPSARCPECEAPIGAEDAFCRSCGASLEPRVRTPG